MSTGGDLDMHVQPAEIVGQKGVFHITLLNQRNYPLYVLLAARDDEDGLRLRIEPADAVVVPAASAAGPVMVHAVPRVRMLVGRPRPYEIEFRGLLPWSEDENTPTLVRRALFTYVPRFTARGLAIGLPRALGWVFLLPLLLLLLLVALWHGRTLAGPATRSAATRAAVPTRVVAAVPPVRVHPTAGARTMSPPAPSIRRFTLVHWRHTYELAWQTSDARNVTLDGRPVGTQGTALLLAPLHSATYRLVATSGARHALAQVHVVVDGTTTDPQAFVLTTPAIATFAAHPRQGRLYAIWRVRNAVSVWLQGQPVPSTGERAIPPGASWLRLGASNDVGSRQSVLHLAMPTPTATPPPPPTATVRPTRTPTRRSMVTSPPRPSKTATPHATMTARPSRTPSPRPTPTGTERPKLAPPRTWTPLPQPTMTPRPSRTPAPPPTATSTPQPTPTAPRPTMTARPTRTPTPPPTARPRPRPTWTPLPRPTRTPRPTMTPTPRPTRTPRPAMLARPTRTPTPPPTARPLARVPASSPTITPRPTTTPTPHPTTTPMAPPAATATPTSVVIGSISPGVLATPPVTATVAPTPSPTGTATPMSVTIGSTEPGPTATPPPAGTVAPTPTAVEVSCCAAQP